MDVFDRLLRPFPEGSLAPWVLTIWVLILLPWIPFTLMVTGMAFEGGQTLDAYLGIVSFWTYPVLVCAAWYLSRKRRWLIFLPVLTAVPFVIEQLLWNGGVRVVFSPAQ